MSRIAVIGAGAIGRSWAISFARAAHEVVMHDEKLDAAEAAVSAIREILSNLAKFDLLQDQSPDEVIRRIVVTSDLEFALQGVSHVQENTPEVLESKQRVFAELDRLSPDDAVLSSSTSALLPSAISAGLPGRHRCLVVHPINPPYVVPAVEVVPAPWTTEAVVQRTKDLMIGIGQSPIVMSVEIAGFIMNRLQGALLHEAFRLVSMGVATAEDIDRSVSEGIGLRWSFIGPLKTISLNAPGGLADFVSRYQKMYETIAVGQESIVDWTSAVPQIELSLGKPKAKADQEAEALWRDRRLIALSAHKRKADEAIEER